MNPVVPDLAKPIRDALLANVDITIKLPLYLGSPTIFTRRPVPHDAPYPMIVLSGNIVKTDQDGISDNRPVITRDLAVYGTNETAAHYRTVEDLADIIYAMFDKVHDAIDVQVGGWNLVSLRCTGPILSPVEDDLHVGRIVTLQIQLGNPTGG